MMCHARYQQVRRILVSAVVGLILFLAGGSQTKAQIYTEVGGGPGAYTYWGTVDVYNPLTDWYYTLRHEYMWKASELLAAGVSPGNITSIAFKVLENVYVPPVRDMKIYGKTTTATTVATTWSNTTANGYKLLYQQGGWRPPIMAYNANGTWYRFDFIEPIQWDGTSNLVIQMCSYRGGYTYAGPTIQICYPNPYFYGTSAYLWVDAAGYCDASYPEYQYSYRPVVQFGVLAGIEYSFPDDVDPRRILRAGEVYNGSDATHPRPSLSFRQSTNQRISLKYKIIGPAPSEDVVYEATQSGNTTITHVGNANSLYTYNFTEATGPCAGANGILDLTNASGGTYRVEAQFSIPGYTQNWQKVFVVSFQNDLATSAIRSPLAIPRKYPRGVSVPVGARIQNVGLNPVTSVRSVAIVSRALTGQEVWRDTVIWTGDLSTGQQSSIDFGLFNTLEVATWKLEVCSELLNATDMQESNNCIPGSGGEYLFQTLYNEEVSAGAITSPATSGEYYARRPFRPAGVIVNGGILDLTDIPVRMEIFQLGGPTGRTRIYNELVITPDVGAELPNNLAGVEFPAFTPPAAGDYEACLTVEYPGDPISGNNQICETFTVGANMSGTYTIGTLNVGQARNYITFQDAVDDLYLKGVSGPVTFELTDANYSIVSTLADRPALDLRTTIIGMDATNTVTFKPTLLRSLSKGAITITLQSLNGIGVQFGQALLATNPNAIQLEFNKDARWYNSAGYFTFDGGTQKSIRVNLGASGQFRAPFYLGDGASNVTLKNLLIGTASGSTASYVTSLPRVFYTNGQFTYEADVRTVSGQPQTYSAGIVSRAKLPVGVSGNNAERLDTLTNLNNVFTGNEISGFGYGIVSLGMGQLIKGGVNEYREYLNDGTMISNNVITDVRRSGVFAGFEENVTISGNEIYAIGGSSTEKSSGITLGGDAEGRYYTKGARVVNNEIHGVTARQYAWGIEVNQARVRYQDIGGGTQKSGDQTQATVEFPGGNSFVAGNVVWDLKRSDAAGTMAGVHLLTRRGSDLLTPSDVSYFTVGDTVANNTIVMGTDNVTGSGAVVGVGIQHANGAVLVNNAIALTVPANAAPLRSAVLFEGTLFPASGNNRWYLDDDAPASLTSNYNAFYVPNSGIARFVEVSATSELVSAGSQDEFASMSQWQSWTGQDLSSVVGDFVSQHVLLGVIPRQHLRVQVTPQPPIGSILNDRGVRISSLSTDIDGNQRGAAGQGYDIGADEFDGRLYVSDLEVVQILSPSNYKSATGATADAEYVMTTVPVDVTARVRNSGALPRTNSPVMVKIYRETAVSNNNNYTTPVWEGTPVAEATVAVNLNSGISTDVAFGLAGAAANFTPQAYEQLSGYTAPARFTAMQMNVTPRYRVVVMVGSDENNSNNSSEKVYRFYIKRSLMSIMVSADGAGVTLNAGSTAGEIASRLNADSLMENLDALGFYNNPQAMMYSYDVLDRSAWETRAVDYRLYRTLFWSHGQSGLSRSERDDLRNFIDAGSPEEKKNLAIGSQELVWAHRGSTITGDANFVRTILRANAVGSRMPASPDYTDKRIVGRAIARNSVETITSTGYSGDAAPMPALMSLYSDAQTSGIALTAYSYMAGDRQTADSISGVATASLTHNTVYLGVDWRHYKRQGAYTGTERVLRGVIDFFEENGGTVVPVELVSFDAQARNTDVDVFWSTASEQDADHFLVERGTETGYVAIATVPAAGTTTERTDYSTTDRNLAPGRYLYRLASVDRDGSTSRTGAVEVVIGGQGTSLSIESIMPNPVVSQSLVTVTLAEAGVATVQLIDLSGRVVATLHNGELAAGSTQLELSAAQLATGTYTLVASSNGQTASMPVTIRK